MESRLCSENEGKQHNQYHWASDVGGQQQRFLGWDLEWRISQHISLQQCTYVQERGHACTEFWSKWINHHCCRLQYLRGGDIQRPTVLTRGGRSWLGRFHIHLRRVPLSTTICALKWRSFDIWGTCDSLETRRYGPQSPNS